VRKAQFYIFISKARACVYLRLCGRFPGETAAESGINMFDGQKTRHNHFEYFG
jgi:hypothetical protein